MKEIRITRGFLKNPFNSVLILLSVVVLIEAVSWSIGYNLKLEIVNNTGGALQYIGLLIRSLFIPELVTLFSTITLLNRFHDFRRLYSVENTWPSISRYELQFLPVLLVAFLVFNPITQTARFLLENFPIYSWSDYWQKYILHTFTWFVYFKYLFPVILIGYIALNISLLKDYLQQRREAQELVETEAAQTRAC